jgi:hypothetical protein
MDVHNSDGENMLPHKERVELILLCGYYMKEMW